MRRLATALLLAVAMLGGCDVPGVTVMQEPSNQPRGPTGFEMEVTLEDSDLAAALGWTEGVPGATVVVHRFIDPFQPETLVTDATGRASLLFLLPGWYAVAGHRVLTDDETESTGGVIRAFGGGLKHDLSGTDTVRLQLRMDERGSSWRWLALASANESSAAPSVRWRTVKKMRQISQIRRRSFGRVPFTFLCQELRS